MVTNKYTTTFTILLILLASPAKAGLIARDLNNDAITDAYFDTALNVTWLKNANLAASNNFGVSGIRSDGYMKWDTADSWISAMNSFNYLGYNDWRLPSVQPINDISFAYHNKYDGSTDYGFNISAPGTIYEGNIGSELAYMFYQILGNAGYRNIDGTLNGCSGTPPNYCLSSIVPFENISPVEYWSSSPYQPTSGNIWVFEMWTGYQKERWHDYDSAVWAVRSGDITFVPEPSTTMLLLIGFYLMHKISRHRKT